MPEKTPRWVLMWTEGCGGGKVFSWILLVGRGDEIPGGCIVLLDIFMAGATGATVLEVGGAEEAMTDPMKCTQGIELVSYFMFTLY
ncbi:hypothetical protein TRIUR3_30289 [Triticum urartu]|uniref:Uncharacterized protein n=1 Tax=Triticum urartu TaxID=4572 RepID=M8ALZ7_TRIUA|nr:hypothetical protein TRIUR3_30289 [Triticum urartu]